MDAAASMRVGNTFPMESKRSDVTAREARIPNECMFDRIAEGNGT
jgi:hypothetical protein